MTDPPQLLYACALHLKRVFSLVKYRQSGGAREATDSVCHALVYDVGENPTQNSSFFLCSFGDVVFPVSSSVFHDQYADRLSPVPVNDDRIYETAPGR
jgi:hypothetical protein